MEEIMCKENISDKTKQMTGLPNNKPKANRHVSVLYGIQYISEVALLKRCRKTEKDCFANINKKQIFSLVHKFIFKLLNSQELLKKVLFQLKFQGNIIQKQKLQDEINVLQPVNQSNMNKPRKQSQESQKCKMDKLAYQHLKAKEMRDKKSKVYKISIMCDEDIDFGNQFSFNNIGGNQSQSSGSAIFSSQSIPRISLINIKEQQFNLKIVEKIYEQPQPFLINLSVCLMLKFLSYSGKKLTKQNVCWILSVGTIVAYKIYYDEPVEGLVDSFAFILGIKREDIINLERSFLGFINYEAVISNQQYHQVLCHLIKQGVSINQ